MCMKWKVVLHSVAALPEIAVISKLGCVFLCVCKGEYLLIHKFLIFKSVDPYYMYWSISHPPLLET